MSSTLLGLIASFGKEISELNSDFTYGAIILVIFAIVWVIVYQSMNLINNKDNAIKKFIPPLLAIIVVLSLIINSNGNVRSAENFMSFFLGITGFIITIIAVSALTFFSVKINMKHKNNFSKLFLCFSLFLSTELLIPFLDNGPSFIVDFLGESFIVSMLGIVNGLSIAGFVWFGIKSIGSFGLTEFSETAKNIKKEDTKLGKDRKTFKKSMKDIRNLIKQGNQIYNKISAFINEKEGNQDNIPELLKTWQAIINKLSEILNNFNKIENENIGFNFDTQITNKDFETARRQKINQLKLNTDSIIEKIKEMSNSINKIKADSDDDSIRDISYNISLLWYNIIEIYNGELDKKLKEEIEDMDKSLTRNKERLKLIKLVKAYAEELENEKIKTWCKDGIGRDEEFDKFIKSILEFLKYITGDKKKDLNNIIGEKFQLFLEELKKKDIGKDDEFNKLELDAKRLKLGIAILDILINDRLNGNNRDDLLNPILNILSNMINEEIITQKEFINFKNKYYPIIARQKIDLNEFKGKWNNLKNGKQTNLEKEEEKDDNEGNNDEGFEVESISPP